MKNIFQLLSGLGLTIPDDKKEAFETDFNANYKTVAEAEKLRAARDKYKSQLSTAQNALKDFECVDVNVLQHKINQLTNDLGKKETEYQEKIADMKFEAKLDSFINKAGAKNTKAVKALLDIETLKTSKNQDTDLQIALEACKSDNDYLFGNDERIYSPVVPTVSNISLSSALDGIKLTIVLTTSEK